MPARPARAFRISRNVFIGDRLLSVGAARTRTLLANGLYQSSFSDPVVGGAPTPSGRVFRGCGERPLFFAREVYNNFIDNIRPV